MQCPLFQFFFSIPIKLFNIRSRIRLPVVRIVPSLAVAMLPPGDVTIDLPLLDTRKVTAGRWYPENNKGSDIIPTQVRVSDIALRPSEPPSLENEGFEITSFSLEKIQLPQPNQTMSPHTPWTDAPRPLKWFVKQFVGYNVLDLQSYNLLTFTCSGELIRGATSKGAASKGSARWPPTFNAHIDQDLSGAPLTTYSSVLPFLFTRTPLTLLNIWMPLNDEQVRPLALRDRRYIADGDLASWTEVAFTIPSDRFVVTNSSLSGWHYSSKIKPGDAYVFLTGETPHTSFGRSNAGDGVRCSVEMRCAAFLLPKDALSLLPLLLSLLLPFLLLRKKRKR